MLLVILLMLLSPLHLMLALASRQEVFSTDAITIDLEPLGNLVNDMHAFVDAAKAVYAKNFVESHFAEVRSDVMIISDPALREIYTAHEYLLNVTRFEPDVDLTSCVFTNTGIDPCEESEPTLPMIHALIYSEVVRTRACVTTIFKINQQAVGLSETLREAFQHLPSMEHIFDLPVSPQETNSTETLPQRPPPEVLAHNLQVVTRVLALGSDFKHLLLSAAVHLPAHNSTIDFEYLENLQRI